MIKETIDILIKFSVDDEKELRVNEIIERSEIIERQIKDGFDKCV